MAPATSGARDPASLAACALRIGLAPECQGLALDEGGNLLADRAVFGGNIITTVAFGGHRQMATVRPRTFPLPTPDASDAARLCPWPVRARRAGGSGRVLAVETAETGEISVDTANIIVAGGRGVKGPEGFDPLRELAGVSALPWGASRAVVDAAGTPYPHQVGQTGKTVRPDMYIACGIWGLSSTWLGWPMLRSSWQSTNMEAPIFNIATFGVVGDLFDVVPELRRPCTPGSAVERVCRSRESQGEAP